MCKTNYSSWIETQDVIIHKRKSTCHFKSKMLVHAYFGTRK